MIDQNFPVFLLLLVGVIVIFHFPGEDRRALHPMTNELAVQPDHLIIRAMHSLDGKQESACIAYVEKAIESMRMLERDADPEGDRVIEAAIRDLEHLEKELQMKKVNEERINHAFLNALNSLALAQLRVSEGYLEEGHLSTSRVAMEYAIKHVKNALRFSDINEAARENRLYHSIHALALNHTLTNDQMIDHLDELIHEMDALVLH